MRPIAAELVPASGPVILAPNHFSFFDHFFLAAALRRKVRFMAKSQLFKPPLQFVYTHGGVFPVRRGHRDDEAFITAKADPAPRRRGGHVLRGRPLAHRRAWPSRPSPASAAWRSSPGAAIVPVAIHGSAKVRNWKRLQFPKVDVLYGEPFRFEAVAEPTREQQQLAADQIFDEIKTLYAQVGELGRRGTVRHWRMQRRSRRPAATAG